MLELLSCLMTLQDVHRPRQFVITKPTLQETLEGGYIQRKQGVVTRAQGRCIPWEELWNKGKRKPQINPYWKPRAEIIPFITMSAYTKPFKVDQRFEDLNFETTTGKQIKILQGAVQALVRIFWKRLHKCREWDHIKIKSLYSRLHSPEHEKTASGENHCELCIMEEF